MEKRELKDLINTKITTENGKFIFTYEVEEKKEKKEVKPKKERQS